MTETKFPYPFSYTPQPAVREAAERLIERIASDPFLDSVFSEGKMLGVLICEASDGHQVVLNGFSGNVTVDGVPTNKIDGFVPPVFDLLDPDGYYKKREAEISAMMPGDYKKEASRELQTWIFSQFVVYNALGESSSILKIFAGQGTIPPGGTGECALPKMLQHAYINKLKPLSFGEFWYGRSPRCEVRSQGCFYPSCMGKCGILLPYMLKGLDVEENPDREDRSVSQPKILFEDDYIAVLNKPSGMLSVPGKTDALSLIVWLQRVLDKRGPVNGQRVKAYSCHRLDMDTSGLLVFAKHPDSQVEIQSQFEVRTVEKSYIARLCAGGAALKVGDTGVVDLPITLDFYDRPRQMVDYYQGRSAVTEYEVLAVYDENDDEDCFGPVSPGEVLVRFVPLTGRTHQLRVHSAHPDGLGRPIKGDRLYGDNNGGRLCLHAATLSFDHPATGERMNFTSLPDRF